MFDKVKLALLQNATALMYYKKGQVLSQSWAHVLSYKEGQVVLQSRAGITKNSLPSDKKFFPENSREAKLLLQF